MKSYEHPMMIDEQTHSLPQTHAVPDFFRSDSPFSLSDNLDVEDALAACLVRQRQAPPEADANRIKMTLECPDLAEMQRKGSGGGEVFMHDGVLVQRMHDGTLVHADGYCGRWMTRTIELAKGYHEPQEEKVYQSVLESIADGKLILELGANWSYYALSFLRKFPNATALLVEPDPQTFAVGVANFKLNQKSGWFCQAVVGAECKKEVPISCESDGQTRLFPQLSVDGITDMLGQGIPYDIILMDIQGAETETLKGLRRTIEMGLVKHIFVSTHHHTISGDYSTHQKCLSILRDYGAHIVAEHTIEESFSGDGLIAAQFGPGEKLTVPVSYNRAKRSLFGAIFGSSEDTMGRLVLKSREQEEFIGLQQESISQKLDVIRQLQDEMVSLQAQVTELKAGNRHLALQLKGCALGRLRMPSVDMYLESPAPWWRQGHNRRRKRKSFSIEQGLKSLKALRKKSGTEMIYGRYGIFETSKEDPQTVRELRESLYQNVPLHRIAVDTIKRATQRSLKHATLLEIGAGIGIVGIQMIQAGLMKRCVSVEPQRDKFALLLANVHHNHLWRSLEPVLANGEPPQHSEETAEVPLPSLDSLVPALPGDFSRRIEIVWVNGQANVEEFIKSGGEFFRSHKVSVVLRTATQLLQAGGGTARTFQQLVSNHWSRFAVLENPSSPIHPISSLPGVLEATRAADGKLDLVLLE